MSLPVPDRHCDVAIAGGGLVGATLAAALAPMGLDIVVIEAVTPRAAQQPSYDDRTLALNHASCRILDGIGLWPALAARATPITEVVVSELDRPGRVRLKPSVAGVNEFGHVVEARAFGAAVLEHLAGLDNVEWCSPARAVDTADAGAERHLSLDGEAGVPLAARLLVAADGGRSRLREALGVGIRHKDYGQVAMIANVMPEVPHAGRAFERMTPTGPLALLPHVEGRCGLVWCLDADEAEQWLTAPEADFLAAATERSGGVLGQLRQLGRRSSYPLQQILAERDRAPRAVIMGNAAHAIHPAGAQGFNLGLRDIAVLVEVLATARRGGETDPGASAALEAYSHWRREDQVDTAAWSDGMVGLFARRGPVLDRLRTLGLLAHAVAPPLQRRVAIHAMGYRGRIPRLALGEPLP